MNKEFNQNTRTLIVSFVFALMIMVPLRFVEFGNNYSDAPAVLGESVQVSEPAIEAPYNEIDGESCLTNELVDKAVSFLVSETDVVGISREEVQNKIDEINKFESLRCK